MKLLSTIGALASVASTTPIAQTARSTQPGLPDPQSGSDSKISIAYDFPQATRLFNQYSVGVHVVNGGLVREIYIDYVFNSLPSESGTLFPTTTNHKVGLDEHYAFVRTLGAHNAIMRVYPNNDSELQHARLTDLASLPGGRDSYADFYRANHGVRATGYGIDLLKGRWWFGGDDDYGPANYVDMPFSNEVMILANPASTDLIQFGITDLYDYTGPDGVFQEGLRFDSEFYINPVNGQIKATPTSTPGNSDSITTIGVKQDAGNFKNVDPNSFIN